MEAAVRIPETADFAMASERSSIRWFCIYAAALFSAGVLILIIIFAMPSIVPAAEGVKPLIAIAGTFISTMGGLPLKEIIARQQRMRYLEWVKAEALVPGADLPVLEGLLLDVVRKGTA